MGYISGSTMNYDATSKGTTLAFNSLYDSTIKYRSISGAKFSFVPDTTTDDKKSTILSKIKGNKKSVV